MGSHSKYAPSSANRWLACPGCISLAAKAPPGESSFYAQEGTAAHTLGEQALFLKAPARDWIGQNLNGIDVTDEMARAVQKYVDYVESRLTGTNEFKLEARVKSEFAGVKVFGTSDAVIINDFGELEIIDYKHGSGKVVEIQDNPQLIIYGLMTMDGLPDYEFTHLRITIVQPRAPHVDGPVRSTTYTLAELDEWRERFTQAIQRTLDEPDTHIPGTHCHWCPGITMCPALRKEASDTAAQEFSAVVDGMTPEQYRDELQKEARVLEYFKKLKERAAQLVSDGTLEIDGYKAVQGYGHPKWNAPDVIAKKLKNKKFKAADIYEKKLISPSKALKLFGEPYREFIEAHSTRKKTRMLLVPVKDKTAKEDFDNE